ncbi:hypothetical protein ARMGADRAFT_1040857 [Armillaria gallica]|uniref:Uncharacterized protein n=1 Tax=Armillaria gallica TaxID=47427 RepID=A0A2H3CDF9_ARMGA|nr:hypothetical protein ARMGADRAFT_1040857 [Armillaria gallica]
MQAEKQSTLKKLNHTTHEQVRKSPKMHESKFSIKQKVPTAQLKGNETADIRTKIEKERSQQRSATQENEDESKNLRAAKSATRIHVKLGRHETGKPVKENTGQHEWGG